MKKYIAVLAAGGALVAAGIAAGSAGTAAQSADQPADQSAAQSADQSAAGAGAGAQRRTFGSIQVVCRSSHTNSDDPIVYPRQRGAAHQHDFFANRSTNAFSTNASLAGKPTTCSRPGDTAAYWTPTLLNNGRRVAPDRVIAYYRARRMGTVGSIRPFPHGLKMIAGSHMATASNPQPTWITNWHCGDGVRGTAKPPASCPERPGLTLRIEFPNCWNGRTLDSADHKSHLAYSGQRGVRGCPTSHPVPVPSLELNFRYQIRGSLSGVRLSSGGVYSGHADFWNSWNQPVLARLVQDCVNAGRICNSSISDAPR